MNGIIGAIKVALMTGHALGGGVGIALRMADIAVNALVRAGQWESRLIMIELRRAPAKDRVADGAVGPEITGDMIGIAGGFVIALVARVTIGAGLVVKRAGLMAGAAVADIVTAHERKAGRVLKGRQIARPGGY